MRRLGRQSGPRWRARGAQGHRDRRPAPAPTGRGFAALVLVARRAADPSRAALDGRRWRKAAGVEIIGDIELFCRERGADRAGRALRRHHRHQRQIDDDGADRPYPARGRPRRADRRQYRHGDPVAGAAGRRPRPCGRVFVLPDRPRAVARARASASCSTSRPTISTGTARWRTTRRSRSGWSPGADVAVVGVDDD